MARIILLFLLATLTVTIASSAYSLYEEPETLGNEYYDNSDSSSRLTKRAIASSAFSEDNSSPEEENEKKKETLVDENSIDSDSAEESSPKAENTPDAESSSDSSDSAEESPKSEEKVAQTRSRRSTNDVRNKNLENLATICPTKNLELLNPGSFLDVKIEIRDMYKICKDLPNRHH